MVTPESSLHRTRPRSLLSRRDLLLAWPVAGLKLKAQGPINPGPAFSAEANLVNLFATVHDGHGRLVRGLSPDEFEVYEDGRLQVIQHFSDERNLPVTVGLIVNLWGLSTLIRTERDATQAFFGRVPRTRSDVAFLIDVRNDIELLQGVTASRDLLQKAAATLKRRAAPMVPTARPNSAERRCGWAPGAVRDAMYLASEEIMRHQSGRKALVLVSTVFDDGSCIEPAQLLESVQRSGTVVYAVYLVARGVDRALPQEVEAAFHDGRRGAEELVTQTGGRSLIRGPDGAITKIVTLIEEELRNPYAITYAPTDVQKRGYRQVRIEAKTKGNTVRTRDGYYRD